MRQWIDIIKEATHANTTLEQVAAARDEFIENPGTDPDYESILEWLQMDGDEPEKEIHAAFFDEMMAHFRAISKTGFVRIYRCISVQDVQKFIAATQKGKRLGFYWASDQESASCEYHPETNHEHEVLVIADAPVSSVDWESSMVANFGHLHEHEISVHGPVHNVQVMCGGKIVATLEKALA